MLSDATRGAVEAARQAGNSQAPRPGGGGTDTVPTSAPAGGSIWDVIQGTIFGPSSGPQSADPSTAWPKDAWPEERTPQAQGVASSALAAAGGFFSPWDSMF